MLNKEEHQWGGLLHCLMYMLGAKYGFVPSADFVAQSVDLGFVQISTDSTVEPRMVLGTISY